MAFSSPSARALKKKKKNLLQRLVKEKKTKKKIFLLILTHCAATENDVLESASDFLGS
jgi:hypothetical protein